MGRQLESLNLERVTRMIQNYPSKYPTPKWLTFIYSALEDNWKVKLLRAQTTVSKYVFIQKGSQHFKIRFSDHKPNPRIEEKRDSDFYVGLHNNGCVTTENLLTQLQIPIIWVNRESLKR